MRRISGRWFAAGVVLSVLLHVVVIVPLMLGWVELGKPQPVDLVVAVELVVLEEPEDQPAPPDEPAAEPLPEPEAAPPPEPEVVKQAELEPVEEPQEKPEAEPETVKAPASEPEPVEHADSEPIEEPQEAPIPQPETAEVPPALEERQVASQPSTLPEPEPSVALPPRPPRKPVLAETLPEPTAEAPPVETSVAQPISLPPAADYLARKDLAEVSREQLLANLTVARDETAQAEANPELWRVIRAVRAQVEGCWLISPAEARNPKLSVDIDVAFDRGGQVTKAQVQEIGRMVVDDEFKAFATTAHGALKACGPFKLPPESYAIWRSFTMRFVPRRRS